VERLPICYRAKRSLRLLIIFKKESFLQFRAERSDFVFRFSHSAPPSVDSLAGNY